MIIFEYSSTSDLYLYIPLLLQILNSHTQQPCIVISSPINNTTIMSIFPTNYNLFQPHGTFVVPSSLLITME